MKRFIYKTIIFILIPCLFFVTNGVINSYVGKNQKVDLNGASTLIVGDSHPMSSLNPDLLYNAKNISQSAEPYVLTFWKIKNIFKSNKIDTLILGFSPHNISEFNDLKFSERKWSSEMFRRSYYINDFNSIDNFIKVDKYEYYKILFRYTSLYPETNHVNFIGGFSSSKTSNVESSKSAVMRHYYHDTIQLGVSKISISYLDSIIDYCRLNDTEVILTSNPVHNSYYENIPSAILSKYKELKGKYLQNNIFVFDKTSTIYPDSLFTDVDHLNFDGATRFSKEFNEARTHNNVYTK